jgi:hypothetical protein
MGSVKLRPPAPPRSFVAAYAASWRPSGALLEARRYGIAAENESALSGPWRGQRPQSLGARTSYGGSPRGRGGGTEFRRTLSETAASFWDSGFYHWLEAGKANSRRHKQPGDRPDAWR